MVYIGTAGDDNPGIIAGEREYYGASGNDNLSSQTFGNNYIDGGSGNDIVQLSSVNDGGYLLAYGGDGIDLLIGFKLPDFLYGGAGSDILLGSYPTTFASGGVLTQDLQYASGADYLDGGEGSDGIYGFDGNDTIYGGDGDDTLYDNSGDIINMTAGVPLRAARGLYGGTGDDYMDGGRGNDSLWGGEGADTLIGGLGNDWLIGNEGADYMDGGLGNDIYTREGNDTIVDGGGIDTIHARGTFSIANMGFIENMAVNGDAPVNFTGNAKANVMLGNDEDDTLRGMAGNDTLRGGPSNDRLFGGIGRDNLTGGLDNDTFAYRSTSESRGATRDAIVDFDDLGNDRIDLSLAYRGKLDYIGRAAFTELGQVHVRAVGGDVYVEANTTGGTAADFTIRLVGTTLSSMTSTDFVL